MTAAAGIFFGFAVLAVGGAWLIGRSLGRPRAGVVAAAVVLAFLLVLWIALWRWVFPQLAPLGPTVETAPPRPAAAGPASQPP